MESKTYSQRLDARTGRRPDVSVQPAVDDSGHVILTVGPHGGPFHTVYLDHAQAIMLANSITDMAVQAN